MTKNEFMGTQMREADREGHKEDSLGLKFYLPIEGIKIDLYWQEYRIHSHSQSGTVKEPLLCKNASVKAASKAFVVKVYTACGDSCLFS